MNEKFVSIKRKDALALLKGGEFDTEVRRVGRHYFVRTDKPLPVNRRVFFNSKGQPIDNGPDALFSVDMTFLGDQLLEIAYDVAP